MAEVKLTKNELRTQQHRLAQLQRYLPTLQLKKAMLQAEVQEARHEIAVLTKQYQAKKESVEQWVELLSQKTDVSPEAVMSVKELQRRYENVAGVEVPYFQGIVFGPLEYTLFDTPEWTETAVAALRELATSGARISIAEEKKAALEKELREVSIRVNLFEKILIPRSVSNVKKIRVFLGDQQLAAVARAKMAKSKIEKHAH